MGRVRRRETLPRKNFKMFELIEKSKVYHLTLQSHLNLDKQLDGLPKQSSPLILINRLLDLPYDCAGTLHGAFARLLRIGMDPRALVLLVAAE